MPLRDRQDNFAGVFCLFTDITEFKVLQQHMALKEKFASLGEMAAGVAHEFRNSLATLTGYLQLLEKRAGSDEQGYASSMQKELQLMQKVVNDFLSFARPVHLNVEPVRLQDLIKDCVEEAKVTAPASFQFEVRGTFPVVPGDEMMLRQIFTNLLRNAVESVSPDAAGRVLMEGALAAEGRFVWIDIQDNGTGIKSEDLTRVFTPFFSTKHTGVGLGLAIVQKLILQHNGAISVDSNSNGTRFRIQLPLESALV